MGRFRLNVWDYAKLAWVIYQPKVKRWVVEMGPLVLAVFVVSGLGVLFVRFWLAIFRILGI